MPSPSQPPTLETPTALTSSPATAISGQSLMDTGHCCFSPWENPQIPCCSLETWWFIPPAMPGPIRVPSDGFGGAGPIALVLMGKRRRKASHGEMALRLPSPGKTQTLPSTRGAQAESKLLGFSSVDTKPPSYGTRLSNTPCERLQILAGQIFMASGSAESRPR